MQFWKLEEPDYKSDYDSHYINGSLEHIFSLPGITCDKCGETWRGSRILPFECPEEMRSHKNIIDSWPIPINEFNDLASYVSKILKKDIELRPGDEFQPSYLDIPSKPNADFLWSSIGSVVVSERIKSFFENHGENNVSFSKVIKRKVGKNSPKHPAPEPSSGEPEDILDEVELIKNVDEVPEYYEMIIKNESTLPLHTKVKGECSKV